MSLWYTYIEVLNDIILIANKVLLPYKREYFDQKVLDLHEIMLEFVDKPFV